MAAMKHILHLVTGAPGAGKTTAVEAFLRLRSDFIALDIDWLIDSASALAGRDIHTDASTWKPYGALWFDVLGAVFRNGRTPVFFAPTDRTDIEKHGLPVWCSGVEWLLLDCDDDTRRGRLRQRPGWTDAAIEEALADAAVLRADTPRRVDTGTMTPEGVAREILRWLVEQGR